MSSQTRFDARSITRPVAELMTYYLIVAILTVPAVIIVLPILWFRYITLRYRFDDEGVSMRSGIFFQRETILTYRRIQDIHVTRDLLQRWLGIATVSVQTASGSALPELKIEGIRHAEELRDFLYGQMRGARVGSHEGPAIVRSADLPARESSMESSEEHGTSQRSSPREGTQLLREIRDHLAALVQGKTGEPQ